MEGVFNQIGFLPCIRPLIHAILKLTGKDGVGQNPRLFIYIIIFSVRRKIMLHINHYYLPDSLEQAWQLRQKRAVLYWAVPDGCGWVNIPFSTQSTFLP